METHSSLTQSATTATIGAQSKMQISFQYHPLNEAKEVFLAII